MNSADAGASIIHCSLFTDFYHPVSTMPAATGMSSGCTPDSNTGLKS